MNIPRYTVCRNRKNQNNRQSKFHIRWEPQQTSFVQDNKTNGNLATLLHITDVEDMIELIKCNFLIKVRRKEYGGKWEQRYPRIDVYLVCGEKTALQTKFKTMSPISIYAPLGLWGKTVLQTKFKTISPISTYAPQILFKKLRIKT